MNVAPATRPPDQAPPGCGRVATYEQPIVPCELHGGHMELLPPERALMPMETVTTAIPAGATFAIVYHWTAPWWSPWRVRNALRRLGNREGRTT